MLDFLKGILDDSKDSLIPLSSLSKVMTLKQFVSRMSSYVNG